jgi:hypothetical protein
MLGEDGDLTVRKIIELFNNDEKRGVEEIIKLKEIGLINYDRTTMDEKRRLYTGTRLIWMHKRGDPLPLDPGEVIHDPIADYLYEQQDQFMSHYSDRVCQKCGRTNKRILCINIDCEIIEDDDLIRTIS